MSSALKHGHVHANCNAGARWTSNQGNIAPHKPSPSTLRPDAIATIESKMAEIDDELREVSLRMHARPELPFEERYAHDVMVEFMEKHGFIVTRHYVDLETAWRAEFTVGSGGRVIGINSEMDALPGLGHACGHNLIGICGLGIAVALKEAMVVHNIPGKIIILGTPAEEGGGGKIIMLDRGAYTGMDVCLMAHPGPGPDGLASDGAMTAVQIIEVDYHGRPAHAAGFPWEGINALDAAVIAYSAISALRQQLRPESRVHGIIQGRDWAPNVIPDNAHLTYLVRATDKDELEDMVERVEGCFRGAAKATGCTVDIKHDPPYLDVRQNRVLSREFGDNITNRYGMFMVTLDFPGSTDFGNVTYAMPAIHPLYAIPSEENGGNHTPEFTDAAQSQQSHNVTLKVAKGLALTGLRVLTDSTFYEEVKESFDAQNRIAKLAKEERHA